MPVLSVDLAFRRWSDLGVVVLERARAPQPGRSPGRSALVPLCSCPIPLDEADRSGGAISCEIVPTHEWGLSPGPVDVETLAGLLNHLCGVRDIRVVMLDGPQAWKSKNNGLEHARVSERQLNTAAKTGLPGMVKPVTYRAFSEFCVDVYDAMCRRGWRRLGTCEQPGAPPPRLLAESYPYAAWKSLGIKPLPSKRLARVSHLAEAFGALRQLIPLTVNRPPNHDQLQAIVGGLPGLALDEQNSAGARIVGNPPVREEGHWREGFIVLPVLSTRPDHMRWMD
jgi:hypothetical protein